MSERKKIYYYLKEIPNEIYKAEVIDGELYDLLPDKHKEFFSMKMPYKTINYEEISQAINMQFGTTTFTNSVPPPVSTQELLNSVLIESYVNDLISIFTVPNSTGINPIATTGLSDLRYGVMNGIFTVTLNGYRWSIDELEDYIVDNLLSDSPTPAQQQVFFIGGDEQD